ncbi:hypothetical protein ACFQ45_16885 [Rhodanobacter aciditrophus]|uniref:Uncharacterized protein n=1 Tax=Rhodanobacter aciditrophus TaxID=1623218 RepID=A0ABW4B725_9GAMM
MDYALAFEVAEYFRLSATEATRIYDEVLGAVGGCSQQDISHREQLLKLVAFNV